MMKLKSFSNYLLPVLAIIIFTACNAPAEETVSAPAKPDMAKLKAEIQSLENAWATASNAKDINALMAMIGDDMITMPENEPMISGKAAYQKYLEDQMAKRAAGETVSYETVELFGSEDQLTEVGKYVSKDSSGNVSQTGKYVAVWEKRDGKYLCIRDIGTADAKPKEKP